MTATTTPAQHKESRIWPTLLRLEEHSHRMHDKLAELNTFKMAQRPQRLTSLLESELKELDKEIAYIREVLSAVEQ